LSEVGSITRSAIAAILFAPPLAWTTFFFATSQELGEPGANGTSALVAIFLMSMVITALGIGAIAVPLTLIANRIFSNQADLVALCTTMIGVGLAWFVIEQEGPVIDFVTLVGFHIGWAAIIYSGVCLHKQRRSKHG
jgi:hypothetical protein